MNTQPPYIRNIIQIVEDIKNSLQGLRYDAYRRGMLETLKSIYLDQYGTGLTVKNNGSTIMVFHPDVRANRGVAIDIGVPVGPTKLGITPPVQTNVRTRGVYKNKRVNSYTPYYVFHNNKRALDYIQKHQNEYLGNITRNTENFTTVALKKPITYVKNHNGHRNIFEARAVVFKNGNEGVIPILGEERVLKNKYFPIV